jgi:hypothetical protein
MTAVYMQSLKVILRDNGRYDNGRETWRRKEFDALSLVEFLG